MAIDVKVGDRVRVTHEGVVKTFDGDELVLADAKSGTESYFYAEGDSMKVKVLEQATPPLPVGSIVRVGGSRYLMDGGSRPISLDGADDLFRSLDFTSKALAKKVAKGEATILHEPSA